MIYLCFSFASFNIFMQEQTAYVNEQCKQMAAMFIFKLC